MGFWDNLSDKFDDAKRSAKRSAKRARKATNSDSTLEAAGKIVVGRTTGKVVGAVALTALELGKAAYEVALEKSEKIQELKADLARYDDEELVNVYKTSTGLRKGVAASILKDRGYGRD